MNKRTLEEELRCTGCLVYPVRGKSMEPMLRQDRDLVHLRLPEGTLKRGDVALYRRPSGQYVLHRVVGEDDRGYVFLGDHCRKKEYGIEPDAVLGVLTEFIRKGKTCSVDNRWYRTYVRLWQLGYPVRFMCLGLKDLLRHLLRGKETL